LTVEGPGPLIGSRGDRKRPPTEFEHVLVVPAGMRFAGLCQERLEIGAGLAVLADRPSFPVIPQERRDLTDGPVQHTGKLDHQVELRDAGLRNQPGGVAPHRSCQLLPRTPLVPLRNLQQLLQTLLSNGHDLGTEHAEIPSFLSTPLN